MIKKILKMIIGIIPCGNVIMFESVPDLADNTMPVFEEMIRRGMNKKYKMVWWVSNASKDFPKYENTVFIDKSSFMNKIRFFWYRIRSKCVISCNQAITKIRENQCAIYMAHGTTVKSTKNFYCVPEAIDYVLIASEPSKEAMARELNADIEKIVSLGYPRNDVMGHFQVDLHPFLEQDYKKAVVWYPTYRQSKGGGKTNAKNALPILHDAEKAIRLNEIAKQQEVLLIVKPHFAQDISYITEYNLSNIVFITDNFFKQNDITSYQFVSSCDALITDYSSIFYDYLLCDKPIAVIWEDIEDYRENPGFGVDVDEMMKCASKIYTLEEFEEFLVDVAGENDAYREERKEINEWANLSKDGKNSQRVVDFIVDKAKL